MAVRIPLTEAIKQCFDFRFPKQAVNQQWKLNRFLEYGLNQLFLVLVFVW